MSGDDTDLLRRARQMLPKVAASLPGLPFEGWHFGDSVAFEAMIAAGDALGAPEYSAFARGFVRGWAAEVEHFHPLDCTAAGHAMVLLAERNHDDNILTAATSLAEYLAGRPKMAGVYVTWERSPLRLPYGPVEADTHALELMAGDGAGAGVFVDCLHFDPPFFAALGRVTGDARWTQEAVSQALAYVALLQHPGGLFHHFHLERTDRDYVLGWGRGQGWALLGLLDVIESAPDHLGTVKLRTAAAHLVSALVATQRPDGHWHAVAGEPRSGDETSTAAFMAHAFVRAARLGVVGVDEVAGPARQALSATVDSLDADGILRGVSAEVWACTMDEHYWYVPTNFVVPWGQGPAALALTEAFLPELGARDTSSATAARSRGPAHGPEGPVRRGHGRCES